MPYHTHAPCADPHLVLPLPQCTLCMYSTRMAPPRSARSGPLRVVPGFLIRGPAYPALPYLHLTGFQPLLGCCTIWRPNAPQPAEMPKAPRSGQLCWAALWHPRRAPGRPDRLVTCANRACPRGDARGSTDPAGGSVALNNTQFPTRPSLFLLSSTPGPPALLISGSLSCAASTSAAFEAHHVGKSTAAFPGLPELPGLQIRTSPAPLLKLWSVGPVLRGPAACMGNGGARTAHAVTDTPWHFAREAGLRVYGGRLHPVHVAPLDSIRPVS